MKSHSRLCTGAATVILLLLCEGCSEKKEPAVTVDPRSTPTVGAAPNAKATTATPLSSTGTPKATRRKTVQKPKRAKPTPATVAAQVKVALDSWAQSQNAAHDFARYIALYDAENFRGVKRTTSGKVRRYDFAGWRKDRARMFKGKPVVAVENPTIKTWLDPGAKFKPGIIEVRFVQRWKTLKYADHGIKVLLFWRNPRTEKIGIMYEDLLNSEPGWEPGSDAAIATPEQKIGRKIDWKEPKNDDEALALWTALAPTGRDYNEKLKSLPEHVKRPMAGAMIAAGKFECTELVESEYGDCGDVEAYALAPLDESWTLDNPCLRRRLALHALKWLDAADFADLADELEAMVRMSEPEEELPDAVLSAMTTLKPDDEIQLRLLHAAFDSWTDARKNDEADEFVLYDVTEQLSDYVSGLSPRGLVEAARSLEIVEIIDNLDASKWMPELIAMVGDNSLNDDLRIAAMQKLPEPDEIPNAAKNQPYIQALTSAAQNDDCALASTAAQALSSLGQPTYEPKYRKGASKDEIARALCLLLHVDNEDEQVERWKQFIHPTKGFSITEDGADSDIDDENDKIVTQSETRENITSFELPDVFGESTADVEHYTDADYSYTLIFGDAEDGALYVTGVEVAYFGSDDDSDDDDIDDWEGCDC